MQVQIEKNNSYLKLEGKSTRQKDICRKSHIDR